MNEETSGPLTAEELIQALCRSRQRNYPASVVAFVGEVSYGENLFGVVEEKGLFRRLEEITETNEFSADRMSCPYGGIIPWASENGRELAVIGVPENSRAPGLLIDYAVSDREAVWALLRVEEMPCLKEIMAAVERGNYTVVDDWADIPKKGISFGPPRSFEGPDHE